MTARTRIQHRDFICKGAEHHRFRAAVRLRVSDDGETVERSAEFMPLKQSSAASGIKRCKGCGQISGYSAGAVCMEAKDGRTWPHEWEPFEIWRALPICPECREIAEESSTYDPSLSSIPAAERMQVWLSADGQRVAVPGKRDALMPSRYLAAGYRTIEAHSLRDLDRIEQIRARQTGNDVFSELNFDAERRRWHAEADYDSEDMTSII